MLHSFAPAFSQFGRDRHKSNINVSGVFHLRSKSYSVKSRLLLAIICFCLSVLLPLIASYARDITTIAHNYHDAAADTAADQSARERNVAQIAAADQTTQVAAAAAASAATAVYKNGKEENVLANDEPKAAGGFAAAGGADLTNGNAIPERHDKKKPSKPLCKACLEIIDKAEPIDISFVDVADGHKEHPHRGATDSNGELGYIHDEAALRKNPPMMNVDEQSLRASCLNRDDNYKMLHEKVFVDLKADEAKQKAGVQRDKIFCLVYTIESGHPNVQRIRETWG